ncbi:MAG: type II secretion system F family protein [Rhodanobacteraceae bacterium]|nr:type II secretion system F family protein [Rhodanobacteraceae bacterium]
MPSFRFKAVAPNGEVLQGQMEAANTDEVVAKLHEQGNLPLEAIPADQAAGAGFGALFRSTGVSQADVANFTQQLATLVGAGLPLDRSLLVLAELAESPRLKRLVDRIRDEVRGGVSLSEALERQHGVFSRLFINMVRAGEMGGTLDHTLTRLSEYLERAQELKSSVVSALIYPCILLLLAGGAMIFLLVFVIPNFMPLFEQLGGELPILTQIVLAMANALRYGWWAIALAVAGVAIFFQRQFADPTTRLIWDTRLINLKWVGDLLIKIDTARFARTAGTLLKNGVPLLSAMSIAKNVLGNSALGEQVESATKDVKTGGGLAHALAVGKRFPRMALQMIAVGEETGQLDDMLLRAADTYDREVRTTIDRLMAAFVPVMTILLAGFIALIVISMVTAILSLNELVG